MKKTEPLKGIDPDLPVPTGEGLVVGPYDHVNGSPAQRQEAAGSAASQQAAPRSVLEEELWRRRQERREASVTQGLDEADAALAPLVLSLARLAAQRDAHRQSAGELEGD